MAGGGVRSDNVSRLVAMTGVTEVHATARVTLPSGMSYIHTPVVYMGGEKLNSPEVEYQRKEATVESVLAIVSALAKK